MISGSIRGGVDLGGPSKTGLRLQLVDARGVVKNRLDGKSYLVIIRQTFSNSNSDETLLAEDQIECHGVQVFSRPRVFSDNLLVTAKDPRPGKYLYTVTLDLVFRQQGLI